MNPFSGVRARNLPLAAYSGFPICTSLFDLISVQWLASFLECCECVNSYGYSKDAVRCVIFGDDVRFSIYRISSLISFLLFSNDLIKLNTFLRLWPRTSKSSISSSESCSESIMKELFLERIICVGVLKYKTSLPSSSYTVEWSSFSQSSFLIVMHSNRDSFANTLLFAMY